MTTLGEKKLVRFFVVANSLYLLNTILRPLLLFFVVVVVVVVCVYPRGTGKCL